ncbi:hypothetical protein L345_16425, partial [Ophiophagus hannah]
MGGAITFQPSSRVALAASAAFSSKKPCVHAYWAQAPQGPLCHCCQTSHAPKAAPHSPIVLAPYLHHTQAPRLSPRSPRPLPSSPAADEPQQNCDVQMTGMEAQFFFGEYQVEHKGCFIVKADSCRSPLRAVIAFPFETGDKQPVENRAGRGNWMRTRELFSEVGVVNWRDVGLISRNSPGEKQGKLCQNWTVMHGDCLVPRDNQEGHDFASFQGEKEEKNKKEEREREKERQKEEEGRKGEREEGRKKRRKERKKERKKEGKKEGINQLLSYRN